MKKLKVGIIGATGMVGQRFILLLQNHPYFEITALSASASSSGKTYSDSVAGRWHMNEPIPESVAGIVVDDASDIELAKGKVDFVFCAINLSKEETKVFEERYAKAEIPVISNNSAHRHTPDVPMLIPEINPDHTQVIHAQRNRLGTAKGFISVKPNCSIQSYVPALTPLLSFGIKEINVVTFQAISGAGKTFETMPEILDNVIPYIGGEEEKSEKEPLRIWGKVEDGKIVSLTEPVISAQCIRVPVTDGHLAAVSVSFERKPSKEEILSIWEKSEFPAASGLPHSPDRFITYMTDDNRPQTRLDRDIYGGMGVTVGRLREDTIFDYKFVCLSHNTLRGAAGGAVLSAELLYRQGFLS